MAILAMDVETLCVASSSLPQIADKLAQLIVEWNVNYHYKNYTILKTEEQKKNEKEANCQDFCMVVLEKLGVKPNFNGALKRYLEDMRKFGVCEMVFRPKKNFRQIFGLEKKSYQFTTHEELDQFVLSLKQKSPTVSIDFPNEMALLKSFDRGFWVRHFKSPERDEYKSLMGVDSTTKALKSNCPFKDPRETGTMAGG